MPFDPVGFTVEKTAELLLGLAKREVLREADLVAFLKEHGIENLENKFESIYINTVVTLLLERVPRPLLVLFQDRHVVEAFAESWQTNKSVIFSREVERAVEELAVGDVIKQEGTEVRPVIKHFREIFGKLVHHARTPSEQETITLLKEILGEVRKPEPSGAGEHPEIPDIILRTLSGLSLPKPGPVKITSEDITKFREHDLSIHNKTGYILHQIRCRIQFPEAIVYDQVFDTPPGIQIICEPDVMNFVAHASGGGSVTLSDQPRPAWDYKIQIDLLPAHSSVSFRFISISLKHPLNQILEQYPEQYSLPPNAAIHFVKGNFQYEINNEYLEREFVAILTFSTQDRAITSLPCSKPDDTVKLIERHGLF